MPLRSPRPPFVSFVIPTFNRASLVGRAVTSALNQSDPDVEVLVVDDGSTDGTGEVVRGIADPRVVLLSKANGERGAARNHGVRHARGQYVYFLDSDDEVSSDHVAHARALLRRLGFPAVLHSRYQRVTRDGRKLPAVGPRHPRGILRALLRRNVIGSYLFVRTDVALRHPFVEDRRFNMGEDWYVGLVLACRYPIYVSKRITRSVHVHEGQSMSTTSPEKYVLAADLLASNLSLDAEFMARHGDGLTRIRAELLGLAALEHSLHGDRDRAFAGLVKVAMASPRSLIQRRTIATVLHALRHRR
jgi:glycosyltransferase involved in cell wall biosynthesis